MKRAKFGQRGVGRATETRTFVGGLVTRWREASSPPAPPAPSACPTGRLLHAMRPSRRTRLRLRRVRTLLCALCPVRRRSLFAVTTPENRRDGDRVGRNRHLSTLNQPIRAEGGEEARRTTGRTPSATEERGRGNVGGEGLCQCRSCGSVGKRMWECGVCRARVGEDGGEIAMRAQSGVCTALT